MNSVKCGISYHKVGKKWDAGVSQCFLYLEEALKQGYMADSCLYWLFYPEDDMLGNNVSVKTFATIKKGIIYRSGFSKVPIAMR